MKFGQLIEYNIRNIFLGKSYTKCSEETIPRPFSKKSKIKPLDLWINTHKFYTVCFYCMLRWQPSKYLDEWPKNLVCFYCMLCWGPSKYVETSLKQVSCLMSTLECLMKGGNGTNGVLENSWGVVGKFLKI